MLQFESASKPIFIAQVRDQYSNSQTMQDLAWCIAVGKGLTIVPASMQTVGDPDRAVPQSLTLPVSSQAEQLTPANFDQVGSAHAFCIWPGLQNPLTKVAACMRPPSRTIPDP